MLSVHADKACTTVTVQKMKTFSCHADGSIRATSLRDPTASNSTMMASTVLGSLAMDLEYISCVLYGLSSPVAGLIRCGRSIFDTQTRGYKKILTEFKTFRNGLKRELVATLKAIQKLQKVDI